MEFWREDAAPTRWRGRAPLAEVMSWQRGAAGTRWGELDLQGTGEALRTRLVVLRFDPRAVTLSLARGFAPGTTEPFWSLDSVPSTAAFAVNAGQFRLFQPWGWVVQQGRELLLPERGPLAGAFVVKSDGRAALLDPDEVTAARAAGGLSLAFQSYPVLLTGDGEVPAALRTGAGGLHLAHRDARLAIGQLEDGRLLLVLTRFAALGDALGQVPLGLTTPEMAAVMGGLGARRALALDGGLSAQLALRDDGGALHKWRGTRSVPLALVATPR